jgi:hypothetical protein
MSLQLGGTGSLGSLYSPAQWWGNEQQWFRRRIPSKVEANVAYDWDPIGSTMSLSFRFITWLSKLRDRHYPARRLLPRSLFPPFQHQDHSRDLNPKRKYL